MIFRPLSLDGAFAVDLDRREDARGFFARVFCAQEFADHGLAVAWMQCNTSFTKAKGALRGLHFQRPPMAEAKLVKCLRGAVFDVIVDLRGQSPTYGRWTSLELSAENRTMAYVPPGFAHGFQTLVPDSELLYFHSQVYSPAYEGGLRYDDAGLSISWPLPVTDLSPRDAAHPDLKMLEPLA
jgi:dTDP-4-dehydrorhamnose 3,5-epimerase